MRRAVVTGGAAGIGRAVAQRLTADGAGVVVADVDAGTGERTAHELGATFVHCDLSTLDGVRSMLDTVGEYDILVNNAGGVVEPRYPDAPAEHWLRMLDLNLRGVMLATQLAADRMAPGSDIVNIASTAGLGFGVHGVPEYAVAKAGVMRLTACLAPLRESRGIRVNCVCPDLTDTPASRQGRANLTEDERAADPPMPAADVAGAVAAVLADPTLAGRTLVCRYGVPPTLVPTGWPV